MLYSIGPNFSQARREATCRRGPRTPLYRGAPWILPFAPRLARENMGKCRGLRTARKLRNHRREQKWHDKQYKKAHLGTALKANPFGGASHAKGIVLEKVGVEAKQPNSAIRKCVRVQLIKNGKKITAFVPNDGCLNFIEENDEVLVAGFGRPFQGGQGGQRVPAGSLQRQEGETQVINSRGRK
uniref:Small ribosomal subunit protein uS12 n=1 Tax=Scophthalmus maximus TaxID=52904 RepID=A0A8D3EAS7_SCOMX